MPKEVEVRGEIWEFPDHMTDGQIDVSIRSQLAGGPAGKPEFLDQPAGFEPQTTSAIVGAPTIAPGISRYWSQPPSMAPGQALVPPTPREQNPMALPPIQPAATPPPAVMAPPVAPAPPQAPLTPEQQYMAAMHPGGVPEGWNYAWPGMHQRLAAPVRPDRPAFAPTGMAQPGNIDLTNRPVVYEQGRVPEYPPAQAASLPAAQPVEQPDTFIPRLVDYLAGGGKVTPEVQVAFKQNPELARGLAAQMDAQRFFSTAEQAMEPGITRAIQANALALAAEATKVGLAEKLKQDLVRDAAWEAQQNLEEKVPSPFGAAVGQLIATAQMPKPTEEMAPVSPGVGRQAAGLLMRGPGLAEVGGVAKDLLMEQVLAEQAQERGTRAQWHSSVKPPAGGMDPVPTQVDTTGSAAGDRALEAQESGRRTQAAVLGAVGQFATMIADLNVSPIVGTMKGAGLLAKTGILATLRLAATATAPEIAAALSSAGPAAYAAVRAIAAAEKIPHLYFAADILHNAFKEGTSKNSYSDAGSVPTLAYQWKTAKLAQERGDTPEQQEAATKSAIDAVPQAAMDLYFGLGSAKGLGRDQFGMGVTSLRQRRTFDRAYADLGLDRTATPEQVRQAYVTQMAGLRDRGDATPEEFAVPSKAFLALRDGGLLEVRHRAQADATAANRAQTEKYAAETGWDIKPDAVEDLALPADGPRKIEFSPEAREQMRATAVEETQETGVAATPGVEAPAPTPGPLPTAGPRPNPPNVSDMVGELVKQGLLTDDEAGIAERDRFLEIFHTTDFHAIRGYHDEVLRTTGSPEEARRRTLDLFAGMKERWDTGGQRDRPYAVFAQKHIRDSTAPLKAKPDFGATPIVPEQAPGPSPDGALVPERTADLEAQVERKAAVFIPKESFVDGQPPVAPREGMQSIQTEDGGVAYYDPAVITDPTPLLRPETRGTLLGMSQPSKPENGSAVVTTRDSEGHEITSEVATAENVDAVRAHHEAQAQPGDTVTVGQPGEVLAARQEGAKAGPVVAPETKVVDAKGAPLRVYHGTTNTFDSFDIGTAGQRATAPTSGLGIFFTADPAIASQYATVVTNSSEGQQVRPAFLNLLNPYRMSFDEFHSLKSPEESAKRRAELASAGHDGVIVGAGSGIEEFVAFDPGQVVPAMRSAPARQEDAPPAAPPFTKGQKVKVTLVGGERDGTVVKVRPDGKLDVRASITGIGSRAYTVDPEKVRAAEAVVLPKDVPAAGAEPAASSPAEPIADGSGNTRFKQKKAALAVAKANGLDASAVSKDAGGKWVVTRPAEKSSAEVQGLVPPTPETPAAAESVPPGWLGALTPEAREGVFAGMRELTDTAAGASARERSLGAPGGAIPVGAAQFDEFVRADAINNVLSAVRRGASPAEAAETAKAAAREAVAKHNARRPTDHNWQRWEGTADDTILSAARKLTRGATPVDPSPSRIIEQVHQAYAAANPRLNSDQARRESSAAVAAVDALRAANPELDRNAPGGNAWNLLDRVEGSPERRFNANDRQVNALTDLANGRVVKMFSGTNPSTPFHELFHVFHQALDEGKRQDILAEFNALHGTSHTDTEHRDAYEWAARMAERYVRDGDFRRTVPERLRGVLEAFRGFMQQVYRAVSGSTIDVPNRPETWKYYDKLFGAETEQGQGVAKPAEGGHTSPSRSGGPLEGALDLATGRPAPAVDPRGLLPLADASRGEAGAATQSSEAGHTALPRPLEQVTNHQEWRDNTRVQMRGLGFREAETEKFLKDADAGNTMIRALLDKEGAWRIIPDSSDVSRFGPIRSNAGKLYRYTLDMTTRCLRRLGAQATATEIMKHYGQSLDADASMLIVLKYREAGKLAPCLYCYVESPRRAMGEQLGIWKRIMDGDIEAPAAWRAQVDLFRKAGVDGSWVNPLKQLDPEKAGEIKTLSVKNLRKAGKELDFQAFLQSQVFSQAKQIQWYERYNGQVWEIPKKDIDYLNQRAGFRILSSSDFQAEHVADFMQAVTDLAARGAKAHAYTKEAIFAQIMRNTGMKIQTSIFAKTAADGTILEDATQGMAWADAKALRATSPNIGTVFVGMDAKQIRWAMAQPWIDYIIPFHHSNLAAAYRQPEGPLPWEDRTSTGKEHWLPGQEPTSPDQVRFRMGAAEADVVEWTESRVAFNPKTRKTRDFAEVKNAGARDAAVRKFIQSTPGWRAKTLYSNPEISIRTQHYINHETGTSNADAKVKYLDICRRLGVDPVFSEFQNDPNYVKVKKDYARTETPYKPLSTKFDLKAAERVLADFIRDGGERSIPDMDIADAVSEILMQGPEAVRAEVMRLLSIESIPPQGKKGLTLPGVQPLAQESNDRWNPWGEPPQQARGGDDAPVRAGTSRGKWYTVDRWGEWGDKPYATREEAEALIPPAEAASEPAPVQGPRRTMPVGPEHQPSGWETLGVKEPMSFHQRVLAKEAAELAKEIDRRYSRGKTKGIGDLEARLAEIESRLEPDYEGDSTRPEDARAGAVSTSDTADTDRRSDIPPGGRTITGEPIGVASYRGKWFTSDVWGGWGEKAYDTREEAEAMLPPEETAPASRDQPGEYYLEIRNLKDPDFREWSRDEINGPFESAAHADRFAQGELGAGFAWRTTDKAGTVISEHLFGPEGLTAKGRGASPGTVRQFKGEPLAQESDTPYAPLESQVAREGRWLSDPYSTAPVSDAELAELRRALKLSPAEAIQEAERRYPGQRGEWARGYLRVELANRMELARTPGRFRSQRTTEEPFTPARADELRLKTMTGSEARAEAVRRYPGVHPAEALDRWETVTAEGLKADELASPRAAGEERWHALDPREIRPLRQEPAKLQDFTLGPTAGKALRDESESGPAFPGGLFQESDGNMLVAGGSASRAGVPHAKGDEPGPVVKAAKEVMRVVLADGSVRRVPPRGLARLMGVPDSYPLPTRESAARTILGNGVPPALVRALYLPIFEGRGLKSFVDLFSGGGIVEIPLREVGIKSSGAVEIDPGIAAHHREAFGEGVTVADVRDVDFTQWAGQPLLASPVCKNFSRAKLGRGETDVDIETAKATARAIREMKPPVVMIENVKEYSGSEAMRVITGELNKAGYRWDAGIYDAAEFGAPSRRERLVIRAVREGELPERPQPTGKGPGWWSAVKDLDPKSWADDELQAWQKKRMDVEPLAQERDPMQEPEFRRWFGESVVRDEAGKPTNMYHGSPQTGFDVFDAGQGEKSRFGLFGDGAYFTDNPEVASGYAQSGLADALSRAESARRRLAEARTDGSSANHVDRIREALATAEAKVERLKGIPSGVYPVYLSIKNPIDMDAPVDPRWDEMLDEDFARERKAGDIRTNEDAFKYAKEAMAYGGDTPDWEARDIMRGYIEGMGFDGITHEGGGRVDPNGVRHRVYIAFEPEQVKSKFNSGRWRADDPRILAQEADEGQGPDLQDDGLRMPGEPEPDLRPERPAEAPPIVGAPPLRGAKSLGAGGAGTIAPPSLGARLKGLFASQPGPKEASSISPLAEALDTFGGYGLNVLEAVSPASAFAARFQAASNQKSKLLIDQAAPKIKKILGSQEELDRFYPTLAASRLEGIKDRYQDISDKAEAASPEQLCIDAKEEAYDAFLSAVAGRRGFDRDDPHDELQDWLKHLPPRKRGGGYDPADPEVQRIGEEIRKLVSGTALKAKASVGQILLGDRGGTPVTLADQVADPKFQEALAVYKRLIEPTLRKSHAMNEGVFADKLGPTDTYFPLSQEDRPIVPSGKVKPIMSKPRNARNFFATGLADGYDTTVERFRKELARSIRSNGRAGLIAQLSSDGLLVPLKQGQSAPPTMVFDNREVPAKEIATGNQRFISKDGKILRLPATRAYIPEQLYNELRTLLETDGPRDQNFFQKALQNITTINLGGPTDAVFHSMNLIGTVILRAPIVGTGIASKIASSLPLIRSVAAIANIMASNPGSERFQRAHLKEYGISVDQRMTQMIENGMIPNRFGSSTYSKEYAATTGSEYEGPRLPWRRNEEGKLRPQMPLAFGPMIYGPEGLDIRARILMDMIGEEIATNSQASWTPNDRARWNRMLGNYVFETEGRIERAAKSSGFSPFYTAGRQMNWNGVVGMFGLGHLPTGEGAINQTFNRYRAAQVMNGIVGLTGAWLLISKVYRDKWPWEDEESRLFQIPLNPGDRGSWLGRKIWGEDLDRNGLINLGFFNPLAVRGARVTGLRGLADAKFSHQTFNHGFDQGEADMLNGWMHPFLGPPAQFVAKAVYQIDPYMQAWSRSGIPGPVYKPATKDPIDEGPMRVVKGVALAMGAANPVVRRIHEAQVEGQPASRVLIDTVLPGLVKGPYKTRGTALQMALSDYARTAFPERAMTAEERQKRDVRHNLESRLRNAGDDPKRQEAAGTALAEALDSGVITVHQRDLMLKGAQKSALAAQWGRMPMEIEKAIALWELATPKEREEIEPLIAKRIGPPRLDGTPNAFWKHLAANRTPEGFAAAQAQVEKFAEGMK